MNEIPQLPEHARITRNTPEDPIYDFEKLGGKIAESVVAAAEAKVAEANQLLEQAKAWADSIKSQVRVQTEALENLNAKLKLFGAEMLEAHRKFNGSNQ